MWILLSIDTECLLLEMHLMNSAHNLYFAQDILSRFVVGFPRRIQHFHPGASFPHFVYFVPALSISHYLRIYIPSGFLSILPSFWWMIIFRVYSCRGGFLLGIDSRWLPLEVRFLIPLCFLEFTFHTKHLVSFCDWLSSANPIFSF